MADRETPIDLLETAYDSILESRNSGGDQRERLVIDAEDRLLKAIELLWVQETRDSFTGERASIIATMQEEVDEWKDFTDDELRSGVTVSCDFYLQILNALKAQRPKGQWLRVPDCPGDEDNPAWDCSECGAMCAKQHNYCPVCGAEMEAEPWR